MGLLKKIRINSVILVMTFLLQGCIMFGQNFAYNSFVPGELWKDNKGTHINAHGGGILFKNDTYFWFGEHKGSTNNAQVGVKVYSSKDLYNWKDEGVALSVSKDPDSEITAGSVMERPKVVFNEKTGKYVMWFHLELKGQGYEAARTGVAVSEHVTGPYQYLKSFRPNAGLWPENFKEDWRQPKPGLDSLRWHSDPWHEALKKGYFVRRDFEKGQMARDMTVFVDDDGTAYHIHSSEENQTLHISELTDDYLDFTGKYVRVQPDGQNEAPAIFKYQDTYYMITSDLTGWRPNAARSFKADSVLGPWKPLGNPVRGTEEDKKRTFSSQSTFILPVQGKNGAFIFMADRWRPEDPIDGRYIWLPVHFEEGKPVLKWYDEWDLDFFDQKENE
ncbi:glycoside hydrolase family 43 protein [Christiangramia crocea]|nr:glycoside hydrolase family 43 protein [Gramella crocea]